MCKLLNNLFFCFVVKFLSMEENVVPLHNATIIVQLININLDAVCIYYSFCSMNHSSNEWLTYSVAGSCDLDHN